MIPPDIQEMFFETLYGEKNILEFEEWLYANKTIESILTPEDYLELICYGYKGDKIKYGLNNILEKLIDKGEYEKWKLLKLLYKALQRDEDLPQVLMKFYDLYCHGYDFLYNLGIGYGLAVEVPLSKADSWYKLTATQQHNLLNSFYPGIEGEIRMVIDWLQSDKVFLTGTKGEYNRYEFIDNRIEEEKQSTKFY